MRPARCEVLAREEAALLVATAEREFSRWHPWILLALRTGLRLGEQIGLQWGDIDWNGRFVIVQRTIVRGVVTSPKSHQRRRVDLSSQLVSTLLQWKRHHQARCLQKGKPLSPWVFPSLEGTPLEERNVRRVFTRMLAKAGSGGRRSRIHDLRHTFAYARRITEHPDAGTPPRGTPGPGRLNAGVPFLLHPVSNRIRLVNLRDGRSASAAL